ncbi:hypothetical protein ACQYE5_002994 [Enterobacter cancerogenus]
MYEDYSPHEQLITLLARENTRYRLLEHPAAGKSKEVGKSPEQMWVRGQKRLYAPSKGKAKYEKQPFKVAYLLSSKARLA